MNSRRLNDRKFNAGVLPAGTVPHFGHVAGATLERIGAAPAWAEVVRATTTDGVTRPAAAPAWALVTPY